MGISGLSLWRYEFGYSFYKTDNGIKKVTEEMTTGKNLNVLRPKKKKESAWDGM